MGDGTLVVLMLRPHLRPFLHQLFAQYDMGVWSAGGKLYVDAICRVLFPHDSLYRPLFQLCWDDVQVETNGLSSYTKPLTTLISRFAHLSLPTLFLVDNRKENGLHFPSQLVIAPRLSAPAVGVERREGPRPVPDGGLPLRHRRMRRTHERQRRHSQGRRR